MQGSPQTLATTGTPSPFLLVEIFSKFFKKILEKEPNYEIYQKEWGKFKELLLKEPMDFDMILIYISTL